MEVGVFIIIVAFLIMVDNQPPYVIKLYSCVIVTGMGRGIQWLWDAPISIRIFFSIQVCPLKRVSLYMDNSVLYRFM